jgi:hypothetical protein
MTLYNYNIGFGNSMRSTHALLAYAGGLHLLYVCESLCTVVHVTADVTLMQPNK